MQHEANTPFSRPVRVDRAKEEPAEFSALKPVSHWIKRDFWRKEVLAAPEPPQEDLSSSYAFQVLRFQIDGKEFLLSGSENQLTDYPEPLPSDSEIRAAVMQQVVGFWVSAWHPNGYPTAASSLDACDEELEQTIAWLKRLLPDCEITPATAVQSRGAWVEGGCILRGVTLDAALEVARRLSQPAVVEITETHFAVRPVDDAVRPFRDEIRLVAMDAAPCPMVRGYETERVCKRWGGPYGSRAFAAAGHWSLQRAVAISRLGCATCEAGKSPFPVSDLEESGSRATASRYGTATVVDANFAAGESTE